ncbi:hypothetical protein MMA231_04358 (plasmid) [Asticcacaulis sp. MM231]|uniref:glycoside hydrolase family 76 protein n=1 Tax=Asticcacaulis sp. MM231 TaxID=3157666 RepID=UPI0032D5ADF3
MRLWLILTSLALTLFASHETQSADVSVTHAADGAAKVLSVDYNNETGQWQDVNWWQSANVLTALIDYMQATGTEAYLLIVKDSFRKNQSYQFGDFKGDSTDDTAWWALALIDMYDLTHDPMYLDLARTDEAYIRGYWDEVCGGGIWWDVTKTYKNAISNELYIKLTAALHNRTIGDTVYLDRAIATWRWLQASGMVNPNSLVNDGLDTPTCTNNAGATYTYNQGVILGGLTELAIATEDQAYLKEAQKIADAVIASPHLSPGGILTEPCEPLSTCDLDSTSFKGIFVRNLGELSRVIGHHPYRTYLMTQAQTVTRQNNDGASAYGLHWAGPFDIRSAGRQHSVLDLFNALQ